MKCNLPKPEAKLKDTKVNVSLYDSNKQLITSRGPVVVKEEAAATFQEFLDASQNSYYMLLNKEKAYYTLFERKEDCEEDFFDVLLEVIENIGEFYDYYYDKENGGLELWIKCTDDKDASCFILFGYDIGVIYVK